MKTPQDIRSTGRKRLRKALFKCQRLYVCVECKITSTKRPPDAPPNFETFWPIRHPTIKTTDSALQANHINKNLLDCDPANGEWLCPSCHKKKDLTSAKNVSTIENEFGY